MMHRLHSNLDMRFDDDIEENPKSILWLSVEGDTEQYYFDHLNTNLEYLNTKKWIIHVLRRRRGDGYSRPEQVLALMEEYLKIREQGVVAEDILDSLPEEIRGRFTLEEIERYIQDEEKIPELRQALVNANITIDYYRKLYEYKTPGDIFAVVIDRDQNGDDRSPQLIQSVMQRCKSLGCLCCITNPCFEFWLLLHLLDRPLSEEEKEKCLKNEKQSNRHTYVSQWVSKKAHHQKSIDQVKFETYYREKIPQAMERAKDFAQTEEDLLDNLGTNLPKLFEILFKQVK